MQRLLLLAGCLGLCATGLFAQPKHDCLWMFGYGEGDDNPVFGGSAMDFCGEQLEVYRLEKPMNFGRTNVAMSDEEGSLQFYTNGVYVANAAHEEMLNGGDLFSPGLTGFGENGMPVLQGALALPWPGTSHKYALFYGTLIRYFDDNISKAALSPLYHAIIDMQFENGLGAVYEKNLLLSADTSDLGKLTAVRHANGRDWWVVSPARESNKMLRFLLTPEGVINYGASILAEDILGGSGYAVFSPDGYYYAHLSLHRSWESYINIWQFDRCTGTFTTVEQVFVDDVEFSGTLAISPNSRYLYYTTLFEVRQFDLWADDIGASMETVAEYDGELEEIPGTGSLLPPVFFMAQLGPDGKIYITSSNTVRSVHVIEHPDLPGEACEVRQRALMLPTLNNSIPNHPNYRLGALEGSPCDTLQPVSAAAEPLPGSGWQLQVQPNPASGHCTVSLLPEGGGELPALGPLRLRLHSSAGHLALEQALPNWPSTGQPCRLELRGLPPGLYFLSVQEAGKPPKTQKLVIIE